MMLLSDPAQAYSSLPNVFESQFPYLEEGKDGVIYPQGLLSGQ